MEDCLRRIVSATSFEAVEEAAVPLADLREELDRHETDLGTLAHDSIVSALAQVFVHLVTLRQRGGYEDEDQATLCDATVVITRLLTHATALAKTFVASSPLLQPLQQAAREALLVDQKLFHPDARMLSANLLLVLHHLGSQLTDTAAVDFASRIDALLLCAGHYGESGSKRSESARAAILSPFALDADSRLVARVLCARTHGYALARPPEPRDLAARGSLKE